MTNLTRLYAVNCTALIRRYKIDGALGAFQHGIQSSFGVCAYRVIELKHASGYYSRFRWHTPTTDCKDTLHRHSVLRTWFVLKACY